MSATAPRDDATAPTETARGPAFALEWLRDEDGDPPTVTVFAPGEDQVTEWLTVDEAHAMPVEETR
jgi:hypothetical protein